ncbi:MAG: VOC family protein [Prevotella sp.]|jgi:methylmalonyl-CoA/ethylmalonyl-CoA epimerase|nr:VOC family protein [Prevotella sp.]
MKNEQSENGINILAQSQFHHIGIAVPSVKQAAFFYKEAGYTVSDEIIEPTQKVIVVSAKKANEPTIELLEPLNDESPVVNILKRSGGGVPYHICYAVKDINYAVDELRKKRFIPLGKPVPGKGVDNALTVFLYNKIIGLIQLVEMA